MKRFFSTIKILGALLLLCLAFPGSASALGISPGLILVEHIPPGARVQKEIVLLRANPSEEEFARVVIQDNIADYVDIPTAARVTLPKGEQQTHVPIFITPKTLPSGTYEGTVTVSPLSREEIDGTGFSVVSGAQARIRFLVDSTLKEEYSISNVLFDEAEEKQKIGFTIYINNTGNADVRPKKIELTFTDTRDPSLVTKETIESESIEFTKAFSEKKLNILTKATLASGLYATDVRVYDAKEKIVFERKDIRFQVLPQGTLAQQGSLDTFISDKQKYKAGELIKLSGTFKNSGDVGLDAEMAVELYKNEDRLDVLTSDRSFIPKNSDTVFEILFRPEHDGKYTAKAKVRFGTKTSNEMIAKFSVGELPLLIIAGGIALILIIAGGIGWLIRKKRRLSANQAPPKIT